MQSWLKALTEKDIATITPRIRIIFLGRIWDICKVQDLVFSMDIHKHQLQIEISFINRFFNSLIELKTFKLWEEQDVQGSANQWVANTYQFL